MVWNKFLGGNDVDRGLSVQQTIDGGFILTGYTASFGAGLDDMLLIKTDASGNLQWQKTFGGSGRDYGNSIIQTSDKGCVITGYTLSFGAGGDDLWIVKTDSMGNQLWSKTLGGAQSDVGNYLIETSDESFLITGHTLSFGAGLHDVWLIKLASIIPVELVSFTGLLNENNVELSWITASEINNKGFEVQRRLNQKISVGEDFNEWITLAFVNGKGTSTELNSYKFIDKNPEPGKYSYRLKQIDFDGSFNYSNIIELEILSPEEFILEQNYPNPFNPVTVISYQLSVNSYVTLKIFDILGKEVETLVNEQQQAGSYKVQFNASHLASGVYLYKLQAGSFTAVKKFVFMK